MHTAPKDEAHAFFMLTVVEYPSINAVVNHMCSFNSAMLVGGGGGGGGGLEGGVYRFHSVMDSLIAELQHTHPFR